MLLNSLYCQRQELQHCAFSFHFFLSFVCIGQIGQKAHNTTTLRLPVPCISQILTTFNLYSERVKMGLKVTISERSDKQWLRFKVANVRKEKLTFISVTKVCLLTQVNPWIICFLERSYQLEFQFLVR